MRKANAIPAAMLLWSPLGAPAVELDGELRDAAARIDYGWYTADVGLIASASDTLAARADGPWVHYLRAYAAYREAELRQARGARAGTAIDRCEREAESAASVAEAEAEAAVLIAACAALAAAEEPLRALLHERRFRQAVARAAALDRDNPRLALVVLSYDRDGDSGLVFAPSAAVDAFRARDRAGGFPDWGEVSALTWLGERRLDEGDPRAARDLLEEALLIAPDHSAALALRRRISDLAQAN
jgi:hypothetical protein